MFSSRIVLWIQIGVAVVLAVGAVFARLRWYRAHGICQSAAYLVTLLTTAVWMVPVFAKFYAPNLAAPARDDLIVSAHAALGAVTVVLATYVVLVAGTSIVPPRWRFGNYRAWMRTLITLWWGTTALGIWTYWVAT